MSLCIGKAGDRLRCAGPVRTLGLSVFHRKFVLSGDSKFRTCLVIQNQAKDWKTPYSRCWGREFDP